jgi:phosphoribosylformylglycinamidine synthase
VLESDDPKAILLALLASPNIASRLPLFQQYDWIVQSRTVRRPEQADAAVLQLPSGGAIATSIDGNGRKVAADPYWGTVATVLECASNLAATGAEPLGTTNNLNFGNPERPEIAWQLTEAVRGIADACRALDAPIVGGNVSLYNQSASGPIYPTPVIGMVGEMPDAARAGRLGFQREGDAWGLAGWKGMPSLAASELAKLRGEALPDGLDPVDLDHCVAVLAAVREAVRSGDLSSCHDIAEGGFLVALAESCLAGELGARLEIGGGDEGWSDALLFGELPCGFIVSGPREALERLGRQIPVDVFGTVGGGTLTLDASAGLEWSLEELVEAHSALGLLFP